MQNASLNRQSEFNSRANCQRVKSNIFRDAVARKIVVLLGNDEFVNKRVILQGGAAMRVAYDSDRLTKDVDFSFVQGLGEEDKRNVLGRIRLLETDGLAGTNIALEVKGIKNGVSRFTYKVDFNSQQIGIPLECDTTAVPILSPSARSDIRTLTNGGDTFNSEPYGFEVVRLNLLVMSPQEMLVDKIFSNVSRLCKRNSFKITDLYDIRQLLRPRFKVLPITPSDILEKGRAFWEGATARQIKLGINRLVGEIMKNRGKLAEEMRFLQPVAAYDDPGHDWNSPADISGYYRSIENEVLLLLDAILKEDTRMLLPLSSENHIFAGSMPSKKQEKLLSVLGDFDRSLAYQLVLYIQLKLPQTLQAPQLSKELSIPKKELLGILRQLEEKHLVSIQSIGSRDYVQLDADYLKEGNQGNQNRLVAPSDLQVEYARSMAQGIHRLWVKKE